MPDTPVSKTFGDKRDEHLKKSSDFRQAARGRLGDNLPYRSALSDAIESIKHSLQAFLWARVGATFPREPSGYWQEVATKGSMPDLLAASNEAGLILPRHEQDEIRELMRLRNSYTHDQPGRGSLVTRAVAERAVALAVEVDRRAQGGKAEAAAAVAPASARAESSGMRPATAVAPATAGGSAHAATANASRPDSSARATLPAASGESLDKDPDEEDTADERTLAHIGRGRSRLWAGLGVAAALIVGMLAGVAVTYPEATGHAGPASWLLGGRATPTALPTATAAPYMGPRAAGNLLITPSTCGATTPSVTLANTGDNLVTWALGSPDTPGASFALSASATPHPTLNGQLPPHASVTLVASSLPSTGAQVVIIADGGATELTLGAC